MKSKTLTIFFVDVQGFTSRTGSQTREENQLFVTEIKSFVEKNIKDKGGTLVKSMGDGFLVTFESPTDAVKNGLEMQKEIENRNACILDKKNLVGFRIGICTGEVNIDEHGDVFGDAVNIAARIQQIAQINEVFISQSTYLSINKSEIEVLPLGDYRFKNVRQKIRIYKVLKDKKDFIGIIHSLNLKRMAITLLFSIFVIALLSFFFYKRMNVKGDHESSAVIATQAQQTKSKVIYMLFNGLFEEGQFERVINEGEALLAREPDNEILLGFVGRAYFKSGKFQKAADCLERALEVDPEQELLYEDLVVSYHYLGRDDDAQKLLRIVSGEKDSTSVTEKDEYESKELPAAR